MTQYICLWPLSIRSVDCKTEKVFSVEDCEKGTKALNKC